MSSRFGCCSKYHAANSRFGNDHMTCSNCGKPDGRDSGTNFCGDCCTPLIADGADAGTQRRQEVLGQGTLLRSGWFQLRQLFNPSGRNNRLTYLKVQVGIVAAWVAVSITPIWSPVVGHLGYLAGLALIVILFVPLSLDEPRQPNQAPP